MHCVRKPRLNSAVATVAVLMVLSLLRVASLSLVMDSPTLNCCHSGARKARTRNLEIPRCAIAHLRSGPSDHPGMTELPLKVLLQTSESKAFARSSKPFQNLGIPEPPRGQLRQGAIKTRFAESQSH